MLEEQGYSLQILPVVKLSGNERARHCTVSFVSFGTRTSFVSAVTMQPTFRTGITVKSENVYEFFFIKITLDFCFEEAA